LRGRQAAVRASREPATASDRALASPPYDFDRVVAPMTVEKFLAEYFGKKTLVLHRQRPDYYADLLSVQMLDDFLRVRRPLASRVFAVDARREITADDYTLADDRIDVARLYQLFADGATITFRQMQNVLPPLAALCRQAEHFFNCPFHTNVYYTPAQAQGFKTHHDTHDVFVLQVTGSKRWRLYDPVVPLPLVGQVFDEKWCEVGPMVDEFTLQAGDLFYCPRGIPHDAHSTDEPSLHITFGALVNTWAEVMIEAMAGACLSDPAFRVSLPPGYAMDRVPPATLEATFRGLVERFAQIAELAPALDGIADEFVASRDPVVPEQRRQMVALDAVTADSWVGARPGLIYRCRQDETAVYLRCHALELTLPRRATAALVYALETERYRVRDLPGNLDDAGKLVLVRRLIREGLVMSVP
jgi:ribosomal protein L16 Arg81 hydroxylase